jgi:LPXTG-motif cell wall-anchored protein
MFSPGYLQTGQNSTGWVWFVILAVLLLVLIIWWFNRRKADRVAVRSETPVQAQRETPPDDLVKLEGIGPKVARVLNEAGITSRQDFK